MSGLYVKHRRTGMYVARQEKPKSASFRMPSANWRWVWNKEDATVFDSEFDTIHPIIQMDIKVSAIIVDGNDTPIGGAA